MALRHAGVRSLRAAGWLPQQLQQRLRSFSVVAGEDSHDDFKPKYKQEPVDEGDVDAAIKQDINGNKVFIYMKGTPDAPQCGFSNMACRILDAYNFQYGSRNVLADAAIREGIKGFTGWPTIPQVFVKGEFIGGSDILMEMHKAGELTQLAEELAGAATKQLRVDASRIAVQWKASSSSSSSSSWQKANYEGTRQLLKLCCYFNNLQSFVHVSSAYTNMNAPVGSLVKEAIYPLSYGDNLVDDYELVRELLAMPAHNANSRAAGLMKAWNFPNNYTLSKHLAEYMVADFHKHCNLPIAIARPTLISSVAQDPYPGYTGNYAGHVGATLAFMAGLFDSPNANNYKASNVWDVIPADVVVNDILAAAAAVSAGLTRAVTATPTRDGRLLDSAYPSTNSSNSDASSHDKLEGLCWRSGKRSGKRRAAAPPLTVDHEPNPALAAKYVAWTGWKVWAVAKVLSWMGQERVARKLSVGFESFALLNQPKTDVNLRFSTNNMQRLAALLDPRERSEFLLLWKPKDDTARGAALAPGAAPRFGLSSTTAAAAAAATACKAEASSGLLQPSGSEEVAVDVIKAKLAQSSNSSRCASVDGDGGLMTSSSSEVDLHTSDGEDCCCSSSSTDGSLKPAAAAVAGQQQRGAVLSAEKQQQVAEMRAIPLQWRDFHINLGAFLYCTVFRKQEPAKLMPITREQCMSWLNIKPEDAFVRHQFNLYK
ncbi:hypothetical protein COO60DRAFT_1702577 [Scenedesmus sp. NREL 46B-D3]|nr:hypothetical protein COO60DRAFT_1702577 [Scenedesmus sp. NREL 46B-D3]